MSTRNELDRRLVAWMSDTAASRPRAGRFEEAIEATRRRRPRPRWLATLGSDWVGTDAPRLVVPAWPGLSRRFVTTAIVALLLAVAVVVAALIGAQFLRPDRHTWRLGSLAYEVDGDIYLADADGTNARRVADGVGWDEGGGPSYGLDQPVWAPDGRHFLFVELKGAPHELTTHISDADGRVVASIPDIWVDATWSPDSTRLQAWIGNLDSTRIGIYGIDGVQQASLPVPDGYARFREWGAAWAPDARSVWVRITMFSDSASSSALCELPIDGSAPRQLAQDDPMAPLYGLTFSRDGSRIAGTTLPAQSLLVANADGSDLRTVEPGAAPGASSGRVVDPIWSLTGTQVGYVAALDEQTSDIRVVDVQTGTTRTLLAGLRTIGSPALLGLSPAGDRILFTQFDDQDRPSLWTVNADGGGRTLLVVGASSGEWQWVPIP